MRSASGSEASAASSATERHRNEGTVSSSTFFMRGGHAGFAEILLRQNVGGDLRPEVGHFDIVETEHDGAIGIPDLAGGQPEVDPGVG